MWARGKRDGVDDVGEGEEESKAAYSFSLSQFWLLEIPSRLSRDLSQLWHLRQSQSPSLSTLSMAATTSTPKYLHVHQN